MWRVGVKQRLCSLNHWWLLPVVMSCRVALRAGIGMTSSV